MRFLQRAFQVSGADTTVASYWKVNDAVTRRFMERFYRNLWEKKMSKLEALREAQLWMLENPDTVRSLVPVDEKNQPLLLGRLHPQRRLAVKGSRANGRPVQAPSVRAGRRCLSRFRSVENSPEANGDATGRFARGSVGTVVAVHIDAYRSFTGVPHGCHAARIGVVILGESSE